MLTFCQAKLPDAWSGAGALVGGAEGKGREDGGGGDDDAEADVEEGGGRR